MNMQLHENSVRLWNASKVFVYKYINIKKQWFVKFLLFLHFIATGKFELLGILPTAILPRPIFSRFTRSSFLFSSPSDACQAGYFQDGGTFVSKLPTFKNLFAFVILTLFKLPDPGASIYVQSLLKFPTWGAQGRSKSPPRPVVPPLGHNIDSCVTGK